MALSGSQYTSFAKHRLVLDWKASQDTASNSSRVTVTVSLQSMDGYGQLWAPASNAGSITVNGSTVSFSANSDLKAYQKKALATRTFTVPHNADGTKSFSISSTYFVNVTFAGTFYGNRTVSGTWALNTIPRASSVSVGTNPVNLGATTKINISRASNAFTHTLKYVNGTYSVTIVNKTTATSVNFVPPASVANHMTNTTSRAGTITCETYSGNTRIGTASASLTVRTVESAVKPGISRIVVSEANPEVTQAVGNLYVQGRSKIRIVTSTTLQYGATVKSIAVSLGSVKMSGANVVSGVAMSSGTIPITVVLTDSRGYKVTSTSSVTLLPYSPPQIVKFTGARIKNDEYKASIQGNLTTSRINSVNVMGYRVEWQETGLSAWKLLDSKESTTQTSFPINLTETNVDIGTSFRVRVILYDKFGQSTSTVEIPTSTVPMSWGKQGTAIGKVYEEGQETFQVRGSGFYEGLLRTARDTYARQGGALNLNNSDMVGLNAVYFGATVGTIDPADNDGEGLLFPHSKTVIPDDGKIDRTKGWDTFRIQDGIVYLNSVPIANDGKALWEGALYLDNRHTITPSIPIRDCPNGWALVWSYYGTSTEDHNFITTFSHKIEASMAGGANHPIVSQRGDLGAKYVYTKPTTILGHANNSGSTSKVGNYVLRWVYAW